MDATQPTSTICNSPSLSASASLCCYGTSSRDQDCTNITSLPSTNTDEARFNFFSLHVTFQDAACKNQLRIWALLLGVEQHKCMDGNTGEHLLSIALAGKGDKQILLASLFSLLMLPPPFPFLAAFTPAEMPVSCTHWRQPGKLSSDYEGQSKPFWEAQSL